MIDMDKAQRILSILIVIGMFAVVFAPQADAATISAPTLQPAAVVCKTYSQTWHINGSRAKVISRCNGLRHGMQVYQYPAWRLIAAYKWNGRYWAKVG